MEKETLEELKQMMATQEDILEQIALTEAKGEKIVKYLSRYKGDLIYNEIVLAIEFGYQLKLEELSTKIHKGEVVDESYPEEFKKQERERGIIITHVDKQETLEEAAEDYWLNDNTMTDNDRISYVNGFKEGAKWQMERSYSEEDMMDYSNYRLLIKKALSPKEWFEQFKNK
jgi:hypothetical protein